MEKQKLILIAEDDPSVNRLLAFKLGKEGYKVRSTSDGKAALKAALEEDIDAAIIDVMMPFLDGIQVLKRIRAEKPQLPIIMLTVKSREEDIHNALELGANQYMTKPFQTAELVKSLKNLLGEY